MRSRHALTFVVACIVPALAAAQTGKPATSTPPSRSTQTPPAHVTAHASTVHRSTMAPGDSTHRVARSTTHKATHAASRSRTHISHAKSAHSRSAAHHGTMMGAGAGMKRDSTHDSTHAATPSTTPKP